MSIVNPMTALAFMDIAQKEHHRAIVNTAAASALGKMIIRLASAKKITVINTVRRKEQMEILKSTGVRYIVNTSDPDYSEQLSDLIKKQKATLILDAIGGEVTNRLCDVALSGTHLIRYGFLSGIRTMPDDDLTSAKKINIRNFFLPHWLAVV
jgi:NADPH:quinone reductase-like Zn-dependent oxidoreductase